MALLAGLAGEAFFNRSYTGASCGRAVKGIRAAMRGARHICTRLLSAAALEESERTMEGIDLKGNPHHTERSYWTSWAFLIFLAFGAMATVLLWSEHRAHLLGVLPYLFLLACPLLHIFGGHGSHGAHGRDRRNPSDNERGQP